jgi:hypothetical protein
VSGSVDVPGLKDFAPTRVGMDDAGVGVTSRYPPAMHMLLRARRSDRLLKKLIAVVWMHRNVAIAVKNNHRDRVTRHLESPSTFLAFDSSDQNAIILNVK